MKEDIFNSGYEFVRGLLVIFKGMKTYRCSVSMALRNFADYWKCYLEENSTVIERDGEEIDVVCCNPAILTDKEKVQVFDMLAKTWELAKVETQAEYDVFGGFVDGKGIAIPVKNPMEAVLQVMKVTKDLGKYSVDEEAILLAQQLIEHDEPFEGVEMGDMRFARLRALLFAEALLEIAQNYVTLNEKGAPEEEVERRTRELHNEMNLVDEQVSVYCNQYSDDVAFIDDMLEEILEDLEDDDDDDEYDDDEDDGEFE